MKAEKYNIVVESNGSAATKVRYGFGAAGEEVQRILDSGSVERVRVSIDGESTEILFQAGRPTRLLDIKQKIKSLSFEG
jgi:hypothetical protein